jgi:hypothetical protein
LNRLSIKRQRAQRKHAPATLRNREPIAAVLQEELPVDAADAVLCINMAHISPWQATLGLVAGAQRLLARGAPLILYGPWRREGVETAASNEAFDASLKARDPCWGLRRVEDLDATAARAFVRSRLVEMPSNNLMLVYRRQR